MKASEVLRKYAAGERNFRGLNLNNQYFGSVDLSEADFSEADIRGANFTKANLRNSRFCRVKAGLPTFWLVALFIVSVLLALIVIALPAFAIWLLLLTGIGHRILLYSSVIFIIPMFFLVFFGRFQWTWLLGLLAFFVIEIPAYIVVIEAIIENNFTYIAWLGALVIFLLYIYLTRIININLPYTKGTNFSDTNLTDTDFTKAIVKNTNFKNAVLTRTDWHQTKGLDKAKVDFTILTNPKVRDLVITRQCAGKDYFGCNLRGANLVDADLINANLTDANISDATFENARLEHINLTRAKALGTNFQGAILTGAILEDWHINNDTKFEHIACDYVYLRRNQDNQLVRLPQDPRRNFAPGEFAKLSQKTLEAIDLVFQDSFDLQPFLTSFEKLQVESGEDKLAIQSIENNENNTIIRVNIPYNLDKKRITNFLQSEYKNIVDNYQQAVVSTEKKYQTELQAKEEQIETYRQEIIFLRELVEKLSKSPIEINVSSIKDNDEAV